MKGGSAIQSAAFSLLRASAQLTSWILITPLIGTEKDSI
jgi:hypothetical protein